jgi:hypothetical protein
VDQTHPAPPPAGSTASPLPWLIGVQAARANVWPGLCVQISMAVLVMAYYRVGWSRPWFDWLAHAKQRGGFFFSVPAAMVAGGLVPEILRIVFFQGWRPRWHNVRDLAFTLPYWGTAGFTVDVLYRAQTLWFGSGIAWQTLAAKVCVDQFIYNPECRFYATKKNASARRR